MQVEHCNILSALCVLALYEAIKNGRIFFDFSNFNKNLNVTTQWGWEGCGQYPKRTGWVYQRDWQQGTSGRYCSQNLKGG